MSLAATTLSGCGGLDNLTAEAPAIPTGSAVSEYYDNEFAVGANLAGYPRDTMLVGIQYVDDHCARYFDSLVEIDRRAAFKESVILTGANQAQVLMGIAEKSAMAIAQVAAVTEITKVLLEQYREKFTFAPHTVELRALVRQSMTASRAQIESINPSTNIEAVMIVKKYAQNCTIAAVHEQWNRSLAKAVRQGVASDDAKDSGNGDTESVFGAARTGGRARSVLTLDTFVVR